MITVTFDIDWAVDEALQYCLDLLQDFKVKATFFATHYSPILKTIESCGHEIGIHPNFIPNFNGNGRPYNEIIDEMMDLFPNARGVRFHSLATSAPVLDYCFQKGILYDSSIYLPFQAKPYTEYTGIKRIPFIRSDLQTVIDQQSFEHNVKEYIPGLPYVYVFHPIHVFLNTHSLDHYNDAKKHYKDARELVKHSNNTIPGARDLLLSVLRSYQSNEFIVTREIYDRFK